MSIQDKKENKSTKTTRKKKETIEEKELKATNKVIERILIAETNIVSILWKNPELYFDVDLNIENIYHNEWKVYFQIGEDLVVKEKKTSLDEMTIELYLTKHSKLKKVYEDFGGYSSIEKAFAYVKEENLEGYISELNKWNVILKLQNKHHFLIADRISEYTDLTSEEIYNEYEAIINDTFSNIESKSVKTYKLDYQIDSLIDKLNEGEELGLPYYNMDILNDNTLGQKLGNMYLLLASSGVGKSTYLRSLIFPSIIKHKEKLVIMINEEDIIKVQKELIVWCANNVYKHNFQKKTLSKGGFSEEDIKIIQKCIQWIKDNRDYIIVESFQSYKTETAIKIIKKYSALGVKYFLIDTFKYDSDSTVRDNNWLELQQNSVKLYDTIKPTNRNVCLMCTMQLIKTSKRQRYLTAEAISGAKNVEDVASGCYMLRWLLPDEYEGESHEIKVYKLSGKNGKSKIPVHLDKNKHYQIMFFDKNRDGSTDEFQLVIEVDLSRNIYKEVGICTLNPDW